MLSVSLFARLEAKPAKEEKGAVTFAVFDAFRDEAGRQAHLEGPIARALVAQAPHLLAAPPVIERVEVLGAKIAA